MSLIKFTGSLLEGTGKSGVLVPDADGYYEVVLGCLNAYSRAGEFYTAEEAINLFKASSVFMRRIKGNAVFSEVGHPKFERGMTEAQYYKRIITIEESNICAHISEVILDLDYGKKHPGVVSPDCIAVIGKVRPTGAKEVALRTAIENRRQNLPFSVRGIKDNLQLDNGKIISYLRTIVTYDFVGEGGIAEADRHRSPALENFKEPDLDVMINRDVLGDILTNNLSRVSLESNDAAFFEEIKEGISKTKAKAKKDISIFDWVK